MNTPKSRRIDDIESLRGLAILMTLLAHAGVLLPWMQTRISHLNAYMIFWSGVDLFFCISGFVIARELLQLFGSAESNRHFWRIAIGFWIKRFYRIWPTSCVWLGVACVATLLFQKTGIFPPPQAVYREAMAILLQIENIHAWQCGASPAEMAGSCTVAGPWWSLSLEEQFYILLPIAAFAFHKKLPIFIGLLTIALIFLPKPVGSFLWETRTDALTLGVLLAILSNYKIYPLLRPTLLKSRWRAWVVIGALFLLLTGLPAAPPVPFSTGMIAIPAFGLVFIASYNQDYIIKNKFLKVIMLWIGSRSFAIYLIHIPVAYITQAIWKLIEPVGTVFGSNYNLRYLTVWLAGTAIFAELNFRFIETPLRIRGRTKAAALESYQIINRGE